MINMTIIGQIPSKSNSYRIRTLPIKDAEPCPTCGHRETHHPSLFKTTEMRNYEKAYFRVTRCGHLICGQCKQVRTSV